MPKMIDLTGRRFENLKVLERAGSKGGHVAWLCKCDCGNTVIVASNTLRMKGQKTCGCLRKEKATARMTKHGGYAERLYTIWEGMKERCMNQKASNYNNYGGRGIKICDEWLNDYAAFRTWALANGYSDNLTIDRIDNNGNYCPTNCRWATGAEQNRNKRQRKDSKLLKADGFPG